MLNIDIDFLEADEEATNNQEKNIIKTKGKIPFVERDAHSSIKTNVLKGISGVSSPESFKQAPVDAAHERKRRGKVSRPRRQPSKRKEKQLKKHGTDLTDSKNKNQK